MEISIDKLKTREDYFHLFEEINKPLLPYLSEGGAKICYGQTGVGFGKDISYIEGFSRLMWGVGPSIAYNKDTKWAKIAVKGLKNGTNPNHPEYWGEISDRDQRMVEMAALSVSLLYNDKFIWNQMNSQEQQHIFEWFDQINHHECANGNWQFLRIIVNLVLVKLGYPLNKKKQEEALERIENCYLAKGWYQDSTRGRQDYYTPFAFQYYGLLYSILLPEDPRSKVFRQRGNALAKDYLNFFAEDGANMPFGRSLTYRYAVVAFWSALIVAGEEPFTLGVMKGIINRNLRWWLKKPIFEANGLLSLGYTYPQLMMTEPYNSPLSPYWSNKIFLLLALPVNHPFWNAEEEAMPSRKSVQLITELNLIAVHDCGHTQFLNAGQPGANYHTLANEKYLKFAYSTTFGFSIPRSNQLKEEYAMDSMLGVQSPKCTILVSKNGQAEEECGQFLVRNKVIDVEKTNLYVASTWIPMSGSCIRTWLCTLDGWQIRIHHLLLGEELDLYETGYAIEDVIESQKETVEIENSNYFCGEKGFSGIVDLTSNEISRQQKPVRCHPNTSTMTPEITWLPGLETVLDKGDYWMATAVYAHPDVVYAKSKWECQPVFSKAHDSIMIILGRKKIVIPKDEYYSK